MAAHMNQQHWTPNLDRWSHGVGRTSASLSGNFWSVLRLEDEVTGPRHISPGDSSSIEEESTDSSPDEGGSGSHGSNEDVPNEQGAPDIPTDQQSLPTPMREMQQVGPTSPLVFPVLGLEGYVLTPATAIREGSSHTNGRTDYYITIRTPGLSLPPIDVLPLPTQPRSARSATPSDRQNVAGAEKKSKYPAVPAGRFQPPPMLGPKPRPALPSLSSAPVVPSWRRRAVSATRVPTTGSGRGYDGGRHDGVKTGDGFNSQLLDSLVDLAWSEPSTPITPIESGDDKTPYISDADGCFRLGRSTRGDLSARRDSRWTDLESVDSDVPLSGGLKSGGMDETMKGEVMPHRSKKVGTPVSILKPTRYRPPEPADWF